MAQASFAARRRSPRRRLCLCVDAPHQPCAVRAACRPAGTRVCVVGPHQPRVVHVRVSPESRRLHLWIPGPHHPVVGPAHGDMRGPAGDS
eukprot:356975-Chlamydomonas_euryale.AAC.5